MLERLACHAEKHCYREIVGSDGYRLKQLDFVPDVVYDIGANVGVFSAWSRHLFPDASIVAVEPDEDNFRELSRTLEGLPRCVLLKAAIGNGDIWFTKGEGDSLHRFMSVGPGYTREALAERFIPSDVSVVNLADLLKTHGGKQILVKIDAEGAEGCLCDDAASTEALKSAAYLTIEFHPWAVQQDLIEGAMRSRLEWLSHFWPTHRIELKTWPSGGMAWMRKLK